MDNYRISNLSEDKSKLDEVIKLIEDSFEYTSKNSFKTDFAFLFTEENLKNCFILTDVDKNKIVGHVGLCERTIQMNQYETPIGFMGGICIHKDYRGQHLFNKFFKEIVESNEDRFSLYLLWSGDPELYLKHGFHLCFQQFSYLCSQFKGENKLLKTKFRDLKSEYKDQIKELYSLYIEKKFNTVKRSEQDWKTIELIDSADLYYNIEENKVTHYFFINKGQDLENTIHELAIDSLNNLKIPMEDGTLWYPNKNINFHYQEEYCCIGKIANFELFREITDHIFKGKLILKNLHASKECIDIVFDGNQYTIGINDLLCGIWGPNKFNDFLNYSKDIYISGLDSI